MYATANLQNRYKQDHVTTASPVDLIVMLYDGCVKQLKLAKIHKESRALDKCGASLEKAQEIILELVRSLNMQVSMSNDLLALYEFMLDRIVDANLHKDMELLDPVIDMLNGLSDAWKQIKNSEENMAYSAE